MLELTDITKITTLLVILPFIFWLSAGLIELSKNKLHLMSSYLVIFILISGLFFFFDNKYIRYNETIGEPSTETVALPSNIRCTILHVVGPPYTPKVVDESGSPFINERLILDAGCGGMESETYQLATILNIASYLAVSSIIFGASVAINKKLDRSQQSQK